MCIKSSKYDYVESRVVKHINGLMIHLKRTSHAIWPGAEIVQIKTNANPSVGSKSCTYGNIVIVRT